MNVDWERLQQEGRLEDPNIQSIINEVKKEMMEQKMKICMESNEQNKSQESQNQEMTILQQLALEQLEHEQQEKKLEQSIKSQSDSNSETNTQSTEQSQIEINKKRCQNCKKSDIKINLCAGCKEVYYCSIDCQKQDWKNHKKQCQIKQEEIKEQLRLQEKMKKKTIDWFTKIDNCGQGNFSIIQKMKDNQTGQIYAIKIVEKKRLKQLGKEKDILMEKHALQKLSGSPYVIELIDTFHDELCLYIQMEYVSGGELWNYCRIFGLIGSSLVQYFFAKLIVALQFIHSKGIIHRDIKSENILVTQDTKDIKFCDFGTCRDALDESIKGSGTGRPGKKMFEHFVGTPNFMAPECVRNKGSDYSCDIYSLGGLIFQLQTGFPPYLGKSEYLIFLQSEKEDPIFVQELWENQEDLKDLILQMLKKDCNERITIENIKKHKYFKNIDWDNIPSYQECLQSFNKSEIFFQNIKGELIEKFDQLNEKLDLVNDIFEKFYDRLNNCTEFEQNIKDKMMKKLKFMRLQANQMFNLEEFFWQDFTIDRSQFQSKSKEDESDEDNDDDQEEGKNDK